MKPGNNYYYIKDAAGNYYRIDGYNQLVVANEIGTATIFDKACGNKRISGSKKAKFYHLVSVNEPITKDPLAQESEIVTQEEVNQEMTEQKESDSTINELVMEEIIEPTAKSVSSYDLSEIDWEEYLTHFIYIVKGMKNYEDSLSKQESDIDQKICDVLHYIELCETDSEEARELVELLRVCREKRRDIKDEMARITYFRQNFAVNNNVTKATQALKSIQGLKTRKYRPRKYAELFENCTWKPARREHLQESREEPNAELVEMYDEPLTQSSPEEQYEPEEEYKMERTRRETPYDNRENDWLKFAKQQAEFYRNAPQYIDNLQLDLEDLDAKIEQTMCDMEDANCNAVQGYMIFKTLKDLRTERKAKIQELQCMYALTDNYKCDVMAEVGEEGLAAVQEIMGVGEEVDEEVVGVEEIAG